MSIQTANGGYINYRNIATDNSFLGNVDKVLGYFGVNTDSRRQQDWQNNEIAQNNQLMRDLYFQEQANKFNAEQAQITRDYNSAEAQKAWERNEQSAQNQRDYETEMSNTAYQRAVEDLKKAGINPILAYSHGASTPMGSSANGSSASSSPASSGGSRSSTSNRVQSHTGNLLGTLLQVVAGIYTKGASNAVAREIASMNNTTKFNVAKLYKK